MFMYYDNSLHFFRKFSESEIRILLIIFMQIIKQWSGVRYNGNEIQYFLKNLLHIKPACLIEIFT